MSDSNDKLVKKVKESPDPTMDFHQGVDITGGAGSGTSGAVVDTGGSTDGAVVNAGEGTDSTVVNAGEGTDSTVVNAGEGTDSTNAGVPPPTSGLTPDGRTWQDVPSPGSLSNAVRLTNEFTTPFGIVHLTNTGECALGLNGLDGNGQLIPGIEWHLVLLPGESAPWYRAAPGAVAIVVAAFTDCGGHAQLTYDTPAS